MCLNMWLYVIFSAESFPALRIETLELVVDGVWTSDITCHGLVGDIWHARATGFDGSVMNVLVFFGWWQRRRSVRGEGRVGHDGGGGVASCMTSTRMEMCAEVVMRRELWRERRGLKVRYISALRRAIVWIRSAKVCLWRSMSSRRWRKVVKSRRHTTREGRWLQQFSMVAQGRCWEPLLWNRTWRDISHRSSLNMMMVMMRRHIREDALNVNWHGGIISHGTHRCLLNKGRRNRYVLQVTSGSHPLGIYILPDPSVWRRSKLGRGWRGQ